jgi:hypothetical protein
MPPRPYLEARDVAVRGNFWAKTGVVARDLSGIASATPLGERRRHCLVVDNESLWAQFAELDVEAATLAPLELVLLLPARVEDIRAFGTAPDDGDPGPDEYILDGEGIAWLDPHYYIAGSHSIHDWKDKATGKKHADYRRSAHLVARVTRDGSQPMLTFRLNELLQAILPHAFLRSPNKHDGINIEGLAAWKDRLYFGFRSPVIDDSALVLSVDAAALFSADSDLDGRMIRVPLGDDVGIRDLATLPDGRFLILAGPRPDAYEGFTINLFDTETGKLDLLGTIARHGDEKPEGLLLAALSPAGPTGASATVLVLSDHPPNGNPRLYDLAIPPLGESLGNSASPNAFRPAGLDSRQC